MLHKIFSFVRFSLTGARLVIEKACELGERGKCYFFIQNLAGLKTDRLLSTTTVNITEATHSAESNAKYNSQVSVMDPAAKRHCLPVKIGTHDGAFHCDEVLACSMLKCLPQYADAIIVRTRDPDMLKNCDIVVDVGGVYDPSKHRYDHHQRSFNESMHSLQNDYNWKTKLSSAGLIYYHFGHQVIGELLRADSNSTLVRNVYCKMYENFVEEIDGIDNGIESSEGSRRYVISTNLSSRVKMMNNPWNSHDSSDEVRFHQACVLVLHEFRLRVQNYATVWWPAKQLVAEAVEKRFSTHGSGRIIEFGSGGCPWKDHLFDIEESENLSPKISFVLFADSSGLWRVQAVPVSPSSFETRVPLKDNWRGLRDSELSKVTGIEGCIFVHATGFIGGNTTKSGALQMAVKSLEAENLVT